MSFRVRVTLAAGLAVLVAVVATSVAVYVLVRRDLRAQIDDSLRRTGRFPPSVFAVERLASAPELPLGDDRYFQVVNDDGEVVAGIGDRALPVPEAVTAVARGEGREVFFDATVDGTPVRVYAAPIRAGLAFEFGRSLTEVNESLRQLTITLVVVSVAGVAVATIIGRLVAAAAVAPVHRLSEAAEAVAHTGELSHHIAASDRDELGRLAASFNAMLDALDASLATQRQLVADASHELRTPLASVRTNVEVLQRAEELRPAERAQLLDDIVAQLSELTRLVSDLVELARGDGDEQPPTTFALDELVAEVIDQARRNWPSATFALDATASVVRGMPDRVSRAVTNLLDNAAKWSPPGRPVEVEVINGTVTVRDHGPGIDPADVPRVFDRFYRSPAARGMPGSGLGLAIVRQVAESHGGSVVATAAPGGGTVVRFCLSPADGATSEA